MQRITNIGCLLTMSVLSLAACGQGGNTGAGAGDSRVRLNSNNAYSQFGDYVVHVSAMLTSDLTPQVAQSYGITRSENQALVNLVVLKRSENVGGDTPVVADVSMSAANLTGQLKNSELREIVDGASVYYIGETTVDDRETINFDFDVRPKDSSRQLLIRFTHQFYTR